MWRSICSTLIFLLSISFATGQERKPVRVALYADKGTSSSSDQLLKVLNSYKDMEVRTVNAAEIGEGKLSGFDLLIHPGGSGGSQGKALGETGREKIRNFVSQGGGYLGICAGAYLASCDYEWSLNILDAKVLDKKHWARGFGPVDIKMTTDGRKYLGVQSDKETIYYHQGPLLAPANNPDIPDYKTLATFDSEITKNGAPEGVMKGTTAIACGNYGKGRVFCFSPHPEKTEGLHEFVHRGILWASTRTE